MSTDTTAINREMRLFEQETDVWLFGYGSLIYKADFAYRERRRARVEGWARRFWQGSHDHRGTPEAPGRVVTLIEAPGAICVGTGYLITPEVFAHLDHREKNGYLRRRVTLGFDDGSSAEGLVYIADPANAAYLGPAPEAAIARHVATAAGPSGPNRDYLLRLAEALRTLEADDPHVFAIERGLLALDADAAHGAPA